MSVEGLHYNLFGAPSWDRAIPGYLLLPPVLELQGHRIFGPRDWVRMKVLMSEGGGLTPTEARSWLTVGEPRDALWHARMDVLDAYLASAWNDILALGGQLPVHLARWTLDRAPTLRHHHSHLVALVERDPQCWSFRPGSTTA
ncbi:MAG: hypothetical protein U1E62_14900 [Alsobacter sp.]